MQRRKFIQNTVLFSSLALVDPMEIMASTKTVIDFPVVRVAKNKRNFESELIEKTIIEFQNNVKDKELGWLFNNCFPNTLDTTVTFSQKKWATRYLCNHR